MLKRWISIVVVTQIYGLNKLTISFIKQNEDKIKGSIKASLQ
jgi:hypothetical protein